MKSSAAIIKSRTLKPTQKSESPTLSARLQDCKDPKCSLEPVTLTRRSNIPFAMQFHQGFCSRVDMNLRMHMHAYDRNRPALPLLMLSILPSAYVLEFAKRCATQAYTVLVARARRRWGEHGVGAWLRGVRGGVLGTLRSIHTCAEPISMFKH